LCFLPLIPAGIEFFKIKRKITTTNSWCDRSMEVVLTTSMDRSELKALLENKNLKIKGHKPKLGLFLK
jgi:hypothetical protein